MWKAVIRSKIEIYGEWEKRIIAEEPLAPDYSLGRIRGNSKIKYLILEIIDFIFPNCFVKL